MTVLRSHTFAILLFSHKTWYHQTCWARLTPVPLTPIVGPRNVLGELIVRTVHCAFDHQAVVGVLPLVVAAGGIGDWSRLHIAD